MALLAVAATLGLAAPGCATSGRAATSTTTTTATTVTDPGPRTSTTEPDAPAEPDAVDPSLTDVPDEVFAGLGDPRIDVADYQVRLHAEPGRDEVAGTARLRLAATTADPLPSFTLDLRGPRATQVLVDGRRAKVSTEADELEITPSAPLEPGESTSVVITYAGEPEPASFPRLEVPVGWQPDDRGGWFTMNEPFGASSWVPVNDHPSDKATWTITLDTPASVTGVANGRLRSRQAVAGRRRWVWETDQPMASYLAFVAIGDYDLVERGGAEGTEVVFAFPPDLSPDERGAFDQLDPILSFFSDTFGPYPDDDAGAAVVDTSLGLAMETQTRPLFGSDAFRGGDAWALAHEVAHQWYGNAVSPARWQDLWLNESFATYADWLWRESQGEGSVRELSDGRGVPSAGGLAVLDPEAAATFDGAVYEGGARALHALRLEAGDDDFFELLRRWFADNRGRSVTTEDFLALARKVTDADVDAWADEWLRNPDPPELPR
ncbi:MAG: M1 family metallopeptidase [Actinobacteria bacterium]|nr:M1 family metallopeptidase [Actinomycetota bacterium]